MQKTLEINGVVLKYKTLVIGGKEWQVLEGITRLKKGWKLSLKRSGKYLINTTRADRGRSVSASLRCAESEFIDQLSRLSPDDLKRKSKAIAFGQRGINVAWAHRKVERKSGAGYTHALLITIVYKPDTDQPSKLKTFHVGSPNTITQRRLNSAMKKAYAFREHYERLKSQGAPWDWPPMQVLMRRYASDIAQYPMLLLEAVMPDLQLFSE